MVLAQGDPRASKQAVLFQPRRIKQQVKLVACPRNHLSRTKRLGPQSGPGRFAILHAERDKRGDLALEIGRPAVFSMAEPDLVDQAAQKVDGLVADQGVGERFAEGCRLLPIELGQVRMHADRGGGRGIELGFEYRLLLLQRLDLRQEPRCPEPVGHGIVDAVELGGYGAKLLLKPAALGGGDIVRWSRKIGQAGKVYSTG